jgi:LacI family transcriptional regulator
MTLEQIAKLAGVSLATASRVINSRPGVRAATRERVLWIIRQQGYQPNQAARSLAARRSGKASGK